MKLASYNPQVNLNTINAHTEVPSDGAAWGADVSGYKALGNAVQIGLKTAEENLTADVMAANSEYNRLMGEGTLKLEQDNKEGNARNITNDYDNLHGQVLDQLKEKYKGIFRYGPSARAFDNMTNKDYGTRRLSVEKYQVDETEKYKDTNLNNGYTESLNLASNDYKNMDTVNGVINNRIPALVAARYYAYGPDKIKEETLKRQDSAASSLVVNAINNSDWDNANKLLVRFGNVIPPEKKSGYEKMINDQIKANKQASTLSGLYEQYKGKDLNAFIKALGDDYDNNHKPNAGFKSYNIPIPSDHLQEEYDGLSDSMKQAFPFIGGMLYNSLGIKNIELTSGKRAAGQAGNAGSASYHVSGNAVDIYIGELDRADGNAIAEKFKPYFDEVLYEKKGDPTGATGDHLHLAGYNGGLDKLAAGNSAPSPAERQKYIDSGITYWNKQKAVVNSIANDLIKKGKNAIADAALSGVTDETSLLDIASKNAINSDNSVNEKALEELRLTAREVAARAKKSSGSGGSGGAGSGADSADGSVLYINKNGVYTLRPDFKQELESQIVQGQMTDLDIKNTFLKIGGGNAPASMVDDYLKMNKTSHNNGVDWSTVKEIMKEKLGDDAKAYAQADRGFRSFNRFMGNCGAAGWTFSFFSGDS